MRVLNEVDLANVAGGSPAPGSSEQAFEDLLELLRDQRSRPLLPPTWP